MKNKKINIKLTKKQYLKILKAVDNYATIEESIAEYEGKKLDRHEYKLRNYLFKFAPSFELEEVDFLRKKRDWTDDLFEDSLEEMNYFSDIEMWENLAWKLAVLEYEKTRKLRRLFDNREKRFVKTYNIYDRIIEEFEKNGLKNIKIVK